MPYKKQKSGKGYFVVNKDTGKKFSKSPLPETRANAQLAALHMNTNESVVEEDFNTACERYLAEFVGDVPATNTSAAGQANPPISSVPNSTAMSPVSSQSSFDPQNATHVSAAKAVGVSPDVNSVNALLNSSNPADQSKKKQLLQQLSSNSTSPTTPTAVNQP